MKCKYLLGHTGCPRLFYTVFQKNIKNIKSTMSLIIILVTECFICTLLTVKISFTYLYPLQCDMVSLKIDESPKCHFSAKGQFLKTLHKQTRALISLFSREKSTLAEQCLSWTTVWIIKVEKSSSCLKRVKNSLERVKLLIRELNYQIIHSRGKVIPLNRWNEVLFL